MQIVITIIEPRDPLQASLFSNPASAEGPRLAIVQELLSAFDKEVKVGFEGVPPYSVVPRER